MKKVLMIIFVIIVIVGLSASYIFVGVTPGGHSGQPAPPPFEGPGHEQPQVDGPTSLPTQ